jgi:hypothetical protein
MEMEITMRGGKNLSAIDWQSREYLKNELPPMAKRIRDRVLQKGTTADGRPLPPYVKSTKRMREKLGLNSSKVDYRRTGQMWNSMKTWVTGKKVAIAGFTGTHKTKTGLKQTQRITKKDGSVRKRSVSNQMIASILAFRGAGKRMPTRPGSYVPPGAFMDLDGKGVAILVRKYSPYWYRKIDAAPPALP